MTKLSIVEKEVNTLYLTRGENQKNKDDLPHHSLEPEHHLAPNAYERGHQAPIT